jgi:hypothetical protein
MTIVIIIVSIIVVGAFIFQIFWVGLIKMRKNLQGFLPHAHTVTTDGEKQMYIKAPRSDMSSSARMMFA